MARTPLFQQFRRWTELAQHCRETGMPADEAVEWSRQQQGLSRRSLLMSTAAALATGPHSLLAQAQPRPDVSIGIVGAGLAGLQASLQLSRSGFDSQIYEAGSRVGGRVWSQRDRFPGQVIERGGEVIDTEHRAMRALCKKYGLTLEDHSKLPGAQYYYFGGRRYSEAEIINEYNAFVPVTRVDVNQLSAAPTASNYKAYDRQIDLMSLADYLSSRQCSPLLRGVLDCVYTTEFGREIDRQSALAFLLFTPTKRFSKVFRVLGSSDERFHIVQGNDALTQAMNSELQRPVALGCRLLAVTRLSSGKLRLSFQTAGGVVDRVHDAAIIAIPAPMMREVQLDAGLNLSPGLQKAIAETDYGSNSKLMMAFNGRPWIELQAANGITYADRPDLQTTWETNPTNALNGVRGAMVDYTGGNLGARLGARNGSPNAQQVQTDADRFASDLDLILPRCKASAVRSGGQYLVHVENWLLHPLTKGAYTNNQPGYFTGLEGLYAQASGNLVFAGEHTDSFYNFQGYMEGGVASGSRAATQVAGMF